MSTHRAAAASLDALATPGPQRPPRAPSNTSLDESIERAKFLVYDSRCHGPLPERARLRFTLFAARGHQMLLAAKQPLLPKNP